MTETELVKEFHVNHGPGDQVFCDQKMIGNLHVMVDREGRRHLQTFFAFFNGHHLEVSPQIAITGYYRPQSCPCITSHECCLSI